MKIISRAEAKALGLTHYYTGKPCKRHHNSTRFVSTASCTECQQVHASVKIEKHPIRHIWHGMIRRCFAPHAGDYEDYGGRGITVCDRWTDPADGYANFAADMGNRPDGCTLDRIDFDGNYEPSNCRWADIDTQNRNRRSTKIKGEDILRIRGLLSEGLTQKQTAAIYECSQSAISYCVCHNAY